MRAVLGGVIQAVSIHGHMLISQGGWTSLHVAVSEGQESVVSLLLDRGADMEACTYVSGGMR